jgi:transposase
MVSNVPKTRPAYPPEFRREAVQIAPREGSQEPRGVPSRHCVTGAATTRLTAASAHRDVPTSAELEELRALRRENARLKQERDLLKRAAAFFAAENERR